MCVVDGSVGGDQVCQETSDLAQGEGYEAVIGFGTPFGVGGGDGEVGVGAQNEPYVEVPASYRRTW